ncbi:MAG: hypothetical protein V4607_01880 [Pseudomonadota bacterium]
MKKRDIEILRAGLPQRQKCCTCDSCKAHALLDRMEWDAPLIQNSHDAADAYVQDLPVNHASRVDRVAVRLAHIAGQEFNAEQMSQQKAA